MISFKRETSRTTDSKSVKSLSPTEILDTVVSLNQRYLDVIDYETKFNNVDPRWLNSENIEYCAVSVATQAQPLIDLLSKSMFFKGKNVTHIKVAETEFQVNKVEKNQEPTVLSVSEVKSLILGNI